MNVPQVRDVAICLLLAVAVSMPVAASEFDYQTLTAWQASLPMDEVLRWVVASGPRAWVGSIYPGGVIAVDVSDPVHPVRTGFAAGPDFQYAAHLDYPLLYVGGFGSVGGRGALAVFDVSSPSPVRLGSVDFEGGAVTDIAVSGTWAYLTLDGASALAVVDVTDPTTPALAGVSAIPGPGTVIELAGDVALLGASGRLRLLDLSPPSQPREVGSLPTPGPIGSIRVRGHHAFVVGPDFPLRVIDVSRPADPVPVGQAATSTPGGTLLHLDGSLGYARSESRVLVYDLSDPATPRVIAPAVHGGEGLALTRGRLFVLGGGLRVYRTGVPVPLPASAADTTFARSSNAAMANGLAVVCGGSQGLGVYAIDATSGTPPTLLSVFPADREIRGVAFDGTFAYVADRSGRMRVVDLTDPRAPVGRGVDLWVRPHTRFLGGLGRADGVVYWPHGEDGVRLFDVSDPDHVVRGGYVDTPDSAVAIAVDGDLACVADMDGLVTMDVSSPAGPVILGTLAIPGQAHRVQLHGGVAYVVGREGLHLVDVSDPVRPAPLSTVRMGSIDGEYSIAGPYLYWADRSFGLHVIDVSNPRRPLVRATIPLSNASVVVADESVLFTANWFPGDGIRTLPLQEQPGLAPPQAPPASRGAITSYPNPMDEAGTTIAFHLPRPGPFELSIHDVTGRLVRTLAREGYGSGERSASWDGRDADGRAVVAGVYFVALSVDGRHGGSTRVVRTR
ncbi:T9SS type A sorting domain-containing protein [bacterium]|nr:T9SS type A sorting domain-containing protein [bacterium]